MPATGPPSDSADPPTLDACKDDCRETWQARREDCNNDRDVGAQQCDDLHGGPDGDPEEYAGSMKEVNNDHSNCLAAAANIYERCQDLCQKEYEVEEDDEEEGDGEEEG